MPGALVLAFPSRSHEKKRNHGSDENQRGDQLGGAHLGTGDETALIPSKALHEEASGTVQNQIPEENLPLELALSVEKKQDQENHKPAEGF